MMTMTPWEWQGLPLDIVQMLATCVESLKSNVPLQSVCIGDGFPTERIPHLIKII